MTIPPQVILSPIFPDYPGIFNALQAAILADDTAGNPTGWNNLAQAGTGTTLLRFMASIGAFGQGSFARALQENYLDTARSPGGVFRSVRLQGVHIIRNRPGTAPVAITRTDNNLGPLSIPANQQWIIGGQSFYNPLPVVISSTGQTVNTTFNRGIVNFSVQTSDASARQVFNIGIPNAWDVSDIELWAVDSLGSIWSGTRIGLWKYGISDQVFFDSTLPDGTVECKFGDGTYGNIPPAGILTFYYVTLASQAVTSVGLAIGSNGSVSGYTAICVTTDIASANQDHPPPDFYKNIGPGGPASNQRAVTRDDYRYMALIYNGVIDAKFRGQAEFNPSDLRWANVIGVTLLTTTPWFENDWITFKQYFTTIGIATTNFVRMDPEPIPINLTINIAIFQTASISAVYALAQSVVTNYFTLSNSSLGFTFEKSDLILALAEEATFLEAPGESGSMIDYISIPSPLMAVTADATHYITLAASPTINVFYTSRGTSPFGNISGL
jgi:hypothetical protein